MTYIARHPAEIALRLLQHLELVGIAIAVAFAIALPLGTFAARNDRVRGPLLAVLGAIYTLPSLALFGYLVPYFGLGLVTTEIALVAYAQLILVRNVTLGLRGVPAPMREAALGLGMSRWQTFWRVEIPQALPVIVGGVRLATVATVSIATLAGKIGAGGLGQLLFAGLDNDDANRIVAGSLAAAALAIGADLALRGVERFAIARAR
ncbi:MAG: ABC transporter permease [Candidatus Eremiobacteraeota bacterium]|nr:ABC transporter permease [Candidatus Eremiobacteraeota bacterium]